MESVLYDTSKGAVLMFVRSLALVAAKQGVRVNGVAPGLVMTPLVQQLIGEQPELQRLLDSQIPLVRRGEINDIGPAAVFLAAPGARYITGQMLYVDGGITAQQMIWEGPGGSGTG